MNIYAALLTLSHNREKEDTCMVANEWRGQKARI